MDIIQSIENEQIRNDLDPFDIGDFVRVHLIIKEGGRERVQVFEGTVIARQGSGVKETFTVRRVSYGVGVERVIPIHSPKIQRIEIVRKGKVRRAKLYYLRERVGKAAKVRTKLQTKAKGSAIPIVEDAPIQDANEPDAIETNVVEADAAETDE